MRKYKIGAPFMNDMSYLGSTDSKSTPIFV